MSSDDVSVTSQHGGVELIDRLNDVISVYNSSSDQHINLNQLINFTHSSGFRPAQVLAQVPSVGGYRSLFEKSYEKRQKTWTVVFLDFEKVENILEQCYKPVKNRSLWLCLSVTTDAIWFTCRYITLLNKSGVVRIRLHELCVLMERERDYHGPWLATVTTWFNWTVDSLLQVWKSLSPDRNIARRYMWFWQRSSPSVIEMSILYLYVH